MVKSVMTMSAIAVILMMIAFSVDNANGLWVCNAGYMNCNNGFCCPLSHPVCVGVGKCCPLAYPIYYNNRCYRIFGRSTVSDTKIDAVDAAHNAA